jgi:hypothetical protein
LLWDSSTSRSSGPMIALSGVNSFPLSVFTSVNLALIRHSRAW